MAKKNKEENNMDEKKIDWTVPTLSDITDVVNDVDVIGKDVNDFVKQLL